MAVQTFRYFFPAGVPQGPDRVFSSWTPDRAFTEREGRQADRIKSTGKFWFYVKNAYLGKSLIKFITP